MGVGDGVLAVQRGGQGDREPLGQLDDFRSGSRDPSAAAGDDHRSLRRPEELDRFTYGVRFRFGPERRHMGEFLLDDHGEVALGRFDSRAHVTSGNVQMDRPGPARRRLPKRLPDIEGKLLRRIDGDVVLGDRCEQGGVIDLLVGIAVLPQRGLLPGNGDDGR